MTDPMFPSARRGNPLSLAGWISIPSLALTLVACGGGGGGKANGAPLISSIAPTSAKEGHPYTYTPAATDPEGEAITWSLVAAPPGAAWVSGKVSWVPTSAQTGSPQAFKLRASDPRGGSADQDWVVIPGANTLPAFSSTPPGSVKEGHPSTYLITAADGDGDALTLTLQSGPEGAVLSGNILNWTPTANQAGQPQAFLLRASDGFGGVREQAWSLTPTPNARPTFLATPSLVAREGSPYVFAANATDADGDPLTFTLVQSPGGATLTGTVLTWSPSPSQLGSPQSFLLRVSDGFGGTRDLAWTLTPAADAAPVFAGLPPILAAAGIEYAYPFKATDPDGDPLTFTLVQAPAGASLSGGTLTWVPSAAQAGLPQAFHLRASDGFGKSADQTWTLTPRASNAAPVFTSTAPMDVDARGGYAYALKATDADGDPLTFSLMGAPTGMKLEGDTLRWTPAPDQLRVSQSVSVKATDPFGASATQSWSFMPSGPVRGTRIITFVGESGARAFPGDVSQFAFAAHIPDGAGGYTTRAGTGTPEGTFTIPSVPGGHYWLRWGSQDYTWTDASSVDLGYDLLGRPDAQEATNYPTTLSLNVSGLNPWTDGDDLQWTVPNLGQWWNALFFGFSANGPAVGATALAGSTINWMGDPLAESLKGDRPWLTQLATRTLQGEPVQVLVKSFQPTGFSQTNGTTTTLSGTLADVPQNRTYRLNWKRSVFDGLRFQINPRAQAAGQQFALDAQPYGTQRGQLGPTPDLIAFQAAAPTDVDFGDISFGDPFPVDWPLFAFAEAVFRVPYLAAGATTPTWSVSGLGGTWTNPGGGTLQPQLGPVRDPRINGRDLFAPQNGVGVLPTLSWQLPSLGTPTGYQVTVWRLFANGTASSRSMVAVLRTKATSLQLPPGLLQSGSAYFFVIRAFWQPGVDYATAPYRRSISYAYAPLMTGVVTP